MPRDLPPAAYAGVSHRDATSADQLHSALLPGVSRTFALTIPQLPEGLRLPVSNAYLLCRIADTIEDEPNLHADSKSEFHKRFAAVVGGDEPAAAFAESLYSTLTSATPVPERELVRSTAEIVRTTDALQPNQRAALQRCMRIMCSGMPVFQHSRSTGGLPGLDHFNRYCYYVAGVVGEMLTDLFSDYSTTIAQHRGRLMSLAVRFGQGLQMTNILKDIWEDRRSGICWLPRETFQRAGFDLEKLTPDHYDTSFGKGLSELIGLAHGYLRDALEYTQLIPSNEVGIRRFCLWSISMAVLTLRKIHRNPGFTSARQVKISRRAVRMSILTSNLVAGNDRAQTSLFGAMTRGLPLIVAGGDTVTARHAAA